MVALSALGEPRSGALDVGRVWCHQFGMRAAVAAGVPRRRRHRIDVGLHGPCTRHACAEQHGGDNKEDDHGADSSRTHSNLPRDVVPPPSTIARSSERRAAAVHVVLIAVLLSPQP
jgi:hypothetical protein